MTAETDLDDKTSAGPGPALDAVLVRFFGAEAGPWLAISVRPALPALALLFGLALISAAAALVPPYLTKLIIDEGLVAGNADRLILWSAAFFAFGLVALGLGALNSILHLRFSARMLADIRRRVLANLFVQSPRQHARLRTGEVMSRLDGDAGEVQQFLFNAALTGSGSMLRLLGGAAMLFVLEWRLALIAVLLAPIELTFFAWARPRTEAHARDVRSARGRLAARIAETAAGLPVIQSLTAEPRVGRLFADEQDVLVGRLESAQRWGEVTRAVPMVLTAVTRAAIFVIGGLFVIAGEWPLGSLIAFTAYLGFLIGPMQSLIGLWHGRARMQAGLERLMALAVAPADIAAPARPRPLPGGPGALQFDGVALDHPQTGARLLGPLDLEIEGAAKVLLTGPTGIGKTSLMALLPRLADPATGRLCLDGADLRDLDLAALRRAIALLPQAGFVFHGTIADNLRLAAPLAADEELAQALDAVELTAELAPRGGPDAEIGERGLDLSGGQRQRLALARLMLRDPKVIAFDESFSEIDPDMAARIMARLDHRFADRTRIVVAHGGEAVLGPFDATIDLTAFAPSDTA